MRTSARWPGFLAPLLLLVCTAAVFWRVSSYPFLLWDDPVYVTERPVLQQVAHGHGVKALQLLSPRLALDGQFWEFYPLRDLTYALDAYVGGMSPAPFHLSSLLLHLLNVLLVYRLARRLALSPSLATLAGALFALHPLIVEPVAWISARKDLLYTSFSLLALLVTLRFPRQSVRSTILHASALVLAAICAMTSKAPGVIAIPLTAWLVWRLLPSDRRRALWLTLIPLALVAIAWVGLVIEIGARNQIIAPFLAHIPGNLLQMLGAPLHALSRFLLPIALSPSYRGWPDSPGLDLFNWAGLLLLALLLLLHRRGYLGQRRAMEVVLIGALLLALLPTSGIIPVAQLRADRFLYLPLVFAALLTARLLSYAWDRRWVKASALAAILLLAWQTHRYLGAWRGDDTLWKHVLAQDPDHPVANGQLAALAMQQGLFDVAKPLLDRSLKHAPSNATTWSNLGRWWRYQAGDGPLAPSDKKRSDQLQQAELAFRHAIYLEPGRLAAAHAQLGLIAWWRGENREAVRLLRKALTLPRCPAEAAFALGQLLGGSEGQQVVRQYCKRRPGLKECAQNVR